MTDYEYYEKYSQFSCVIPKLLYGMRYPPGGDQFIDFLNECNITGFVTLTENKLKFCENFPNNGIEYLHLPIIDYCAPSVELMDEFVLFVDKKKSEGGVLCHCMGGHGRTGTMLAGYFISKSIGTDYKDCINKIRELRPGSVESQSQVAFLKKYEEIIKDRASKLKK